MSFTTHPTVRNSAFMTVINWLIEPTDSIPQSEKRQTRLMQFFLLVLITFALIYGFLYSATKPQQEGIIENISSFLIFIVAYLLCRRGYWKLALYITVFSAYLSLWFTVAESKDPINEISVLTYLVIPMFVSSIFLALRDVLYITLFYTAGIFCIPFIADEVTFYDLALGILPFLWSTNAIIFIGTQYRNTIEKDKQTELQFSETRFRQMAENILEVFWTYELAGDQISYASPAYEKVIGQPIEPFIKDPQAILETVHEEDRNQTQQMILEIAGGNSSSTDARIIHPDGSTHWVWARGFPIFDELGKVTSMAGIISDITEIKQAQEKLSEANATLEQRVRERTEELVAANIALDKAARMKDEFLAGMSHELRTPLTSILGFSEALQINAYGELNEKQNKVVKTIEESGRHLLELINDVLDLAKIEAGKLDLQFGPCSLNEICQASIRLTKGVAHQKNQQVQYTPSNDPIKLHADARRLKQVLVNLLSNAVKFTPEDGELGLEVQLNALEQRVHLTVWDKGIGIKPEDVHKLFKPFTQIDSSLAREYSGTGLGLSLVYSLVDAHNGSIEVESEFGKGSRFTITLPWSPQGTAGNSETSKENSIMQNGQFDFDTNAKPYTVMVADDNLMVLQMLTDFLELQQYRVIKARSGMELLEKVEETRPDILLVDIQMPRIDGLETIRRIRALHETSLASIPVIAVTALAMPGDKERCMQAGASEYISKPLKLNELTEMIKRLLKK